MPLLIAPVIMLGVIALVALCYLLGSIPVGYLLIKYVFTRGEDIRQVGSGGTGATNVTRRAGRAAGVLTYLLDFGKGAAAVLVMRWAGGGDWWLASAATAAVVGHIYPVFLGFRGGKGVATAGGAFFVLAPYAVLSALPVWVVAVYITRYVSLGSILGAATVPLWTLFYYGWLQPSPGLRALVATGIACFALISYSHRANITRLLNGTEHKVGQRIKPHESGAGAR